MQGGASALAAAKSSIAWSHPLAMLLLGIRNLGLGGWMPAECMALENEVTAWQQDAEYDSVDNALRFATWGCQAREGSVWHSFRHNNAWKHVAHLVDEHGLMLVL
jgi:hypothetical protein